MNIFSKEWTPPSASAVVQSPDMEKTLFRPSSPSDRADSFQSWLDRTDRHFTRDEGSPRGDPNHSRPRETEWRSVTSQDQPISKRADPDQSEQWRPSSNHSHTTGENSAMVEEEVFEKEIDQKEIVKKETVEKETIEKETVKKEVLEEGIIEEEIYEEENHDEKKLDLESAMLLQHLALLLGNISGLSEEERKEWIQFLHALKAQDHSQSSYGAKLQRIEGMSVKQAVNTLLNGLKENTQTEKTSKPNTLQSGIEMLSQSLDTSEDRDLEGKTLVSTDGIQILKDETTVDEDETTKLVPSSSPKDGQNPTDTSQDTTKIPVQDEAAFKTNLQAKPDPDQAKKQAAQEKTDSDIPLKPDEHAGEENSKKALTQKGDIDEQTGKESLIKVPPEAGKSTHVDQDLSRSDRLSDQARPMGTQEKGETVSGQKDPVVLELDRSAEKAPASSSALNSPTDPDLPSEGRALKSAFSQGVIVDQPVLKGQVAAEQDQPRRQVLPNRHAQSPSYFVRMQQMPKEALDKAQTLLKLSKTFLERFQQVKLEQGGLKVRVEEFYVRKLNKRVEKENPDRRSGNPVRGNEPTDPTKAKPIIQPRPKAQHFSPYDRQPAQGRMATVSQLMNKADEGQHTRQSESKERTTWRQEFFQRSSENQQILKTNELSRQQAYTSPRSSKAELSESRGEDKAYFAKNQTPTMHLEQQIRFSPQVLERSMEEVIQKVQELTKLARQTLHTATIQLNPPQLGKVELEIQKMGSKVLVSMQVETEQAKEMLQRNSHLLVSRLSITGYDIQRIHIHMEKHEEQGDHHQQENHNKQDNQEQQEHNPKARQEKALEDQALTPEFSFAELLKGVEQHV